MNRLFDCFKFLLEKPFWFALFITIPIIMFGLKIIEDFISFIQNF
jgi:hypothetical protein